MKTSSSELFKKGIDDAFTKQPNVKLNASTMNDAINFKKSFTEEKLEGGLSDKKSLLDVAMKHAFGEKSLTTRKKIESILKLLKVQMDMGMKIEMEHTNDKQKAREIAMDHLMEDPKYYSKLKKIETKEDDRVSAKKQFASDLQNDKDYIEFKKNAKYKKGGSEFTFGVPNVTSDDPYIKKRKWSRPGKEETTEATSSGSSGAFSGPIAFKDSEFLRKSFAETPKLKEGLEIDGDVEKVEATEATGSGSVGGYSTPAMWAKSTKKKDWGPSRKTQLPGGAFVKVKKKCTKFPYCNQGDINALKITRNESVREVIKRISEKYNIGENVIVSILENEYDRIIKRVK